MPALHPAASGCLPRIGGAAAAKQRSQRVWALRWHRRVLGGQLRLRGVPLHSALLWRRLPPLLLPALPRRCSRHCLPLCMCLQQICVHCKEPAAASASAPSSSSSSSSRHRGAVVLDVMPGASALPRPPGPRLTPSRQLHLWHRAAPPRRWRLLLRAQPAQHRLKLLSQRQRRLLLGLCCWCSWAGWGLQGGCAARQGGGGRVLLLLCCRACFCRWQAARRWLDRAACMRHGISGATSLQKGASRRQAGLAATAATRCRRRRPPHVRANCGSPAASSRLARGSRPSHHSAHSPWQPVATLGRPLPRAARRHTRPGTHRRHLASRARMQAGFRPTWRAQARSKADDQMQVFRQDSLRSGR